MSNSAFTAQQGPTGATGPPGSPAPFHGVRVGESTDQSINSGADTIITFVGEEEYDTDGYHSDSVNTGRLTVPGGLGGYYHVTGHVRWNNDSAGTYRRTRLYKNGAEIPGAEVLTEPEAAGWAGHVVSCDVLLAAADYIELHVDHDKGSATNVQASNARSTLSMFLVGT